jgi:hypothetical protein
MAKECPGKNFLLYLGKNLVMPYLLERDPCILKMG